MATSYRNNVNRELRLSFRQVCSPSKRVYTTRSVDPPSILNAARKTQGVTDVLNPSPAPAPAPVCPRSTGSTATSTGAAELSPALPHTVDSKYDPVELIVDYATSPSAQTSLSSSISPSLSFFLREDDWTTIRSTGPARETSLAQVLLYHRSSHDNSGANGEGAGAGTCVRSESDHEEADTEQFAAQTEPAPFLAVDIYYD
ncbi:hypothetical protein H4582DRAFT_2082647 [Lactarius indigo]|nr:hypothetical protein H4582DRAFT_2082647 [Lactarius indigo]